MNKIWQSVAILFTLNAALLGFAFVYENTFAAWDNEANTKDGRFRFITLSQILTPDTLSINKNAEQIAEDLLKSDTLTIVKMEKKGKIDSAFLDKPGDTTALANLIVNPGALDDFFAALIQEKDNTLVRVAHYGDSQLEGDRVTEHIRRNLQAKFGGGGLGYVPFDDVASNSNYTRTNSGKWWRYNVFNMRRKNNSYYGLSGSVFRFAKGSNTPDSTKASKSIKIIKPDSTIKLKKDTVKLIAKADTVKKTKKDTTSTKTAKALPQNGVLKNASVTYRLAKWVNYERVSLMYGQAKESFGVKCFTLDNQLIYTDSIAPLMGFANKKLNIPAGLKGFKLEFTGTTSPDLYGLQIDDTTGIIVDNYAIRGHSGDGLFRINDQYLAQQLQGTNTKLIIFQYGANMLPYLESDKECKYYEDAFYRLFKKFKKAAPNAAILVIGNGDMGFVKEGEEKSYPFVRCLSNVQKNAATRAGCSFWSLLDAMGGENAILTWNRKGLCALDGHLSPKGQKIIANLIFKAIMREYNNYILKQQNS